MSNNMAVSHIIQVVLYFFFPENNSELTIKNSQKIEDLEAEIRNLKDNNIPKNITGK